MKHLIKILLILLFVSLSYQRQYNVFELEYSYQTKNLNKIEPYFKNIKNQLSSFVSISPFSRKNIKNINTPICKKLYKSYKMLLSIDFKIEIIEPSKNDYEKDEELKYEICQIIKKTKRPI